MMLFFILLFFQTHPTTNQIRDLEQVRVPCPCDTRPGTFIHTNQLSTERRKTTPPDGLFSDPIDQTTTVCIVIWERINYTDGPSAGTGYNFHHTFCFTQTGLAILLQDPDWLSWWNSQP